MIHSRQGTFCHIGYSTGTCYDVVIDNSTDQLIEVPPQHSVCFVCQLKEDNRDISWKIGGLDLPSGNIHSIVIVLFHYMHNSLCILDVVTVLSNGTLQVTNSSTVFSTSITTELSCSTREEREELTFTVRLRGWCNTHSQST